MDFGFDGGSLTVNGINEANLANDFVTLPDLAVSDSFLGNSSFFKDFDGACPAVLASTFEKILLPPNDYAAVALILQAQDSSITYSKEKIWSPKNCDEISLSDIAFQLKTGLVAILPKIFYTRNKDDGCQFLFAINNLNNGYMLGLPFMQAFEFLLDFESGAISLAQKKEDFGAKLIDRMPEWKPIDV